MKLRCFTSLIATMVMASTAGAVEVYNNNGSTLDVFGNISGGQFISKNKANNGHNSFVRYGLTSRSEINDKIFAFTTWESEFSLQKVEDEINLKNGSHAILGYVGISIGEFGKIDYGRNYGILYDVSSWTDIIPEFGRDLSIPDNFLSNRASNVFTYRNSNFFGLLNGLNFAVQYQMKNDINQYTGRTVKTANGEGYGLFASYMLGSGVSTSAAYTNSRRTTEQKNLDGPDAIGNAEEYLFGIKYDDHGMYIAAIYGENYNVLPFGNFNDPLNPDNIYGFVNKAKNIEVVAKYSFDVGFTPLISYMHSKASDIENGYANYLKKYITIGTSYAFNKSLATSINYRLNLLNKNDFTTAAKICTDDLIALGMSYVF